MQARMKNPAFVITEAMQPMQALGEAVKKGGVPAKTLELVHLRISQINSCAVCIDGGVRLAKRAGETDERLFAVAAWREAPYFTDAERAALELAEALTRIADRPDPVPDALWDHVKRHYDERGLAALVIMISTVNVWNRMNIATRQIAGEWKP